MNLPNFLDAKKRTKDKVNIVRDDYIVPEIVKDFGVNKIYHIIVKKQI